MNKNRKIILLAAAIVCCLGFMKMVTAQKPTTERSGQELLLIKEKLSPYGANVLSSLEEPGVIGHLNHRILSYDSLCKGNELQKAILMRSEDWRKYVSLELWKSTFDKKKYTITDISVLGEKPFPSKTTPATMFEIIKMAVLEKNDGTFDCVFYTEVWAYEQGDWFTRGGAPWDNPPAPVITLEY